MTRRVRAILPWFAAALFAAVLVPASAAAQSQAARFLAKEDIELYGVGLKAEPAQQTVPKDIATIVSTILVAPDNPDAQLPPFASDAVVMATLRGPSFAAPLQLTARPNTPFNIPPLTVAGAHTLEDIRLVSGGEVLLRATPESVRIDVIEKLLVTQVVARPLTAAEIREKGLIFDKSSYQAYNFTAAFAIQDQTIDISFPIVLPSLQGAPDVAVTEADIPAITPPTLQGLKTIIPDTLRLQTQIPNLTVVGFTLKLQDVKGQNFVVPPIPGVVVIPGDIGFLDQVFSVLLMVSNVAPDGSNLVVRDLSASIVLPPGNDLVVGTPDDPLVMGRTAQGETPRVRPITQPGPDGKLGTADDIVTLGPGETGNAEFIVEGRREGSHVVEMEISGTLLGLPVGPVTVRGRAAGAVLVRNPTFSLTFTHPDVVTAGEAYTLDVTVTNTSASPANFVSVNLFPRNVSGATVVGDASREIETIAPGDSASVTFDLVSKITGKVTAATLDSDSHVAGRFELKTAVGELGVPLSPDSLVLPKEANTLPKSLRDAAIGLLGKAHAVATAPAAALPKDLIRFTKQVVWDRAVEVAEAGLRVTLHEPLRDSAAQLAMDFMGSNYARLADLNPTAGNNLPFIQNDYTGFDLLRRRSIRGDVLAQAIADIMVADLAALGPAAFHLDVAQKISYRPGHISVLAASAAGPMPFTVRLVDANGNAIGGADANGKIAKEIPFGDFFAFKTPAGDPSAAMAVIATPTPGDFVVELSRVAGAPDEAAITLSIVVPNADGTLRQIVFDNVTAGAAPQLSFADGAPYRLSVSIGGAGSTALAASTDASVVEPAPSIIGLVQQADADKICDVPIGRVVAVLFSKEVTPESVQDKAKAEDITNYTPDENKVVGVAMQPGRRIVFLGLRDPVGPLVPRQMTIEAVADPRGHVMPAQTMPIEMTVPDTAAVVSGRVLRADGSAIPFANVRLFHKVVCAPEPYWMGITSKSADANGEYGFDYVTRMLPDRLVAVDPETEEFRGVQFTVARNGQHLNVDVVLLGRGTFTGRTLDEANHPLARTNLRITSLTDQSQYAAITDETGSFTIARIPVGSILIEAVNTTAKARTFITENIPFAGATTTRDLVLLSVDVTNVTVEHGTVTGHVLRSDANSAVAGAPVILYYRTLSQPGVTCPAGGSECPIAVATTDDSGAFRFDNAVAGNLRLSSFDQASYQQGEVSTRLEADGAIDLNLLLGAGLATVNGLVLDPTGAPVAGARVGGGLSLTTTGADGHFTLTDVPVGHAQIVAVSDALAARGVAGVDIVRAGEVVNATIVLESNGGVGGTVFRSDGATAVANLKVYVFRPGLNETIEVVGVATTDANGHYSISSIPLGDYTVSAFLSDFSDGNITKFSVKFFQQVVKADVIFRGAGGHVAGHVFDDDGVTPLKARVGLSGDRVLIAGGIVGTAFKYVDNFAIVDTNFTTGEYSFGGLWTGAFTIRAAGQFSPDPIALEGNIPTPNASVQMDLRLQPTSRIAGTVFLPDGVTAAGPNLVVHYKSDEYKIVCTDTGECTTIPQGIQEENVVTDDYGRFLLPVVNAGNFTITVEDQQNNRTGQIHGAVKAGEQADLPVRLVGRGEITVHVIASDAHTAIPGAKVDVEQIDFPRKKMTVYADTFGTVVLGGGDAFTEGAFVLTATDVRNGFAGRGSGKIVTDGEQVSVNVYIYDATGSVSGTVFRPDATTPVPNADVVIANAQGPLAFTITDANGGFNMPLIPLGAFTVDIFEAATARRAFATASIDVNGQQVVLTITEAALGVVRGTVLEQGPLTPLKGWTVSVRQTAPGGRGLPALLAMSSVDGTFSVPGVSQGPVTVVASKTGVNGSGSATSTIAHEGQVVEIPLLVTIVRPLFGTIEGRVFNPDGSAAGSAGIDVCTPVCGEGAQVVHVTAAGDGTFTVSQVPFGRFQVRAQAQTSHNVGTVAGQIAVDGETVGVTVVMIGLSTISGTVFRGDGTTPAVGAEVVLEGSPGSGCNTVCTAYADQYGVFTFENVPAHAFTITATDPVSGFRGVVGDTLNPGETKQVRIVVEATGSLTGFALASSGPAAGVVAELIMGQRHLFAQSKSDGSFTFATTPLGTYQLNLQDPVGSGIAFRNGTIGGNVSVGNVVLDEAPPLVAATTPAASATRVPLGQALQITFSEQVDAGTINAENVVLSDGLSTIQGTIQLTNGDTRVTLTPLSPLKESTLYSVRVAGVKDLVGKLMPAPYLATFTTVDLTPPSFAQIDPAPSTSGVPIYTTVRLKYSEPIDPARFAGPAVQMTGPGGAITGTTDFAFSNTVAVFTPTWPLNEGAIYTVHTLAATDLAGNVQAPPADFTFGTTKRTPPVVLSLTADNNGHVIENTVSHVTADVGTANDVAFVDFSINDVFAFTSRSAPFTIAFKALPEFGAPGQAIKVSAVATDTSGNRGVQPVSTSVTVTADQPPAISITAPSDGISAANGTQVVINVLATDDVGIAKIGIKANTGTPQDAKTIAAVPPATDLGRSAPASFAFHVPLDAVPGSPIVLDASVVDAKGQAVAAVPVHVTVLDSVAPAVAITGATTGDRVKPGQTTTAIVTAQDLGGVHSITFSTSGVVTFAETRTLDPAQPSTAASFTFSVPANATTGQSVTLSATAADAAGNVGNAASVILPVADIVAPFVKLSSESGSTEVLPGQDFNVVADASDDQGVAAVQLSGSGAFIVNQARQVSPPTGSAHEVFTIQVPASAVPGTTLNLTARATDISGNTSPLAALGLSVKSIATVTLPSSVLVNAGETADITVELAPAAPANGLRVDFATTNTSVAAVTPYVLFAAGETSKTITVTGFSGGSVSLNALIQGAVVGTTTVVVQGGLVDGVVVDSQLNPVAGVQVTVSSGYQAIAAETDGSGRFAVAGLTGPLVTVTALDPQSGYRGFASGSMNTANGYAHLTVILIQAGLIHGTVLARDGQTPAGEGVRVDIFSVSDAYNPLATTFTDPQGHYEFPLVTIGSYTLVASATSGDQGRASASIVASGQSLTVDIGFLGKGTVAGTVIDGSGNPVPNADLTFWSHSVVGSSSIERAADPDGTFHFDGVNVGTFEITAHDPVTEQAGSASGAISSNEQVVNVTITLASYGNVQGVVRRADGITIAANAEVTAGTLRTTRTNTLGEYSFNYLPLGSVSIVAHDPATRGLGRATGALAVNGQTVTIDVQLIAQGRLLVTVVDANGAPIAGANVMVHAVNGSLTDDISATTGSDGTVLVEHVLTGTLTISASGGGLSGSVGQVTLSADELKNVTVALESTATIAGQAYLPDGASPATSGHVQLGVPDLWDRFSLLRTVTLTDGTFQFDGVQLGDKYWLRLLDASGRLRAFIRNIALTSNGQIETRTLTQVGLGSVTGRVINPDGSSAQNIGVTVHALNANFGGFKDTVTNAAGIYTVDALPVGLLAINAGDASRGLLGEATQRISADGEAVTADVLLQSNALTLPVQWFDANGSTFDVQQNGRIGFGTNNYYNGYDAKGAARLTLTVNGTATEFAGSSIATVETGGREIVTHQDNIGGLNVVRKIFVPKGGYFARYLEILTNPTASPAVVSLQVANHLNVLAAPIAVVATSSGDATVDVSSPDTADRWVIVDDADVDPFFNQSMPAELWVFDGAGAAARAMGAAFSTTTSCYYYSCYVTGHVTYQWQNITVPAGATVAYMHFVVQEVNRSAALAAAGRLSQLAPEAIEGLNAEEIGAIQNFAVPADGVSQVPPLPALNGSISGQVLEADGVTLVPNAAVRFQSQYAVFSRVRQAYANTLGQFTFAFAPDLLSVPVESFTLYATHPATGTVSPATPGGFAEGQNTTVQNVVFTNTAEVSGRVRRHTGDIVTGGAVTLVGPGVNTYTSIATDGLYRIYGVPPGTYTLTASISVPQGGSGLTGIQAVTVVSGVPGGTVTADITIQPTGTITGIVYNGDNSRVAGLNVGLDNRPTYSFQRYTTTDSAGQFTLFDVPVGNFTLAASEPISSVASTAVVSVQQDQTTTQNLILIGLGTLDILVQSASGVPVPNAPVQLQQLPRGTTFSSVGSTGANGHLQVQNVTAGAFTVRAIDPARWDQSLQTDLPGTLSTGETKLVPVSLPGVGSITGTLRYPNGTVVVGATIRLYEASTSRVTKTTDASGAFSIGWVPLNRTFTVRGYNPTDMTYYAQSAPITFTANAQTAALDLVLPIFTSLRVQLLQPDGVTPLAGSSVELMDAFHTSFTSIGSTDASGYVTAQTVPEGLFTIQAYSPTVTYKLVGVGSGRILPTDQGRTVDFVLVTGAVLPRDLFDANGFRYDIQESGELDSGTADAYSGSYSLSFDGEASGYFLGANFGTVEANGREIGISESFTGVDVTRKIFVPSDGYFARYLEQLTNTGTSPVTITVDIDGDYGWDHAPRATSSGDASVTAADQWVLFDDDTGSNPYPATAPTVGDVLGGPGASVNMSPETNSWWSSAYYYWDITIPPGQTVTLMHFTVQNANQAAARAAVERLVQLPPEALADLTPEERASIVNFVVPADGSSTLAPLPPRGGTVTGRVLTGDGVTPIVGAPVSLQSTAAPMMIVPATTSGTDATFSFAGVPIGAFTLTPTIPLTGSNGPSVAGTFEAGQTAATQDVVVSTAGVVRGTVSRNGTAVSSGTVAIAGGALSKSTSIDASGAYRFIGVPAGTFTLSATVGTVTGYSTITPAAGQTLTADIAIGSAAVSGTISFARGIPAPGAQVALVAENASVLATTTADAAGAYSLTAPLGRTFTVRAVHPTNSFAVAGSPATAVLVDGVGVTVNVSLPASATVRARVVSADGTTPLAGVNVFITRPGAGQAWAGPTDANGLIDIPNVPQGASSVLGVDGNGQIGPVTATVAAGDDAGIVNVTLVGQIAGTVSGTLFAADGVTSLGGNGEGSGLRVTVRVFDAATSSLLREQTVYDGTFSISGVVPGPQGFVVRVVPYSGTPRVLGEVAGNFTSRNEVFQHDITLALPVVKGTVRKADGTPVPYPDVFLRDAADTTTFAQVIDAQGQFVVISPDAGTFTLEAQDYSTGLIATAEVTFATVTDILAVDLTMSQTATVEGTVFTATNTPVTDQNAQLGIASSKLGGSRWGSVDATGHYSLTGVPVGAITVQACHYLATTVCRTVAATISGDSTVDIVLPPTATLSGHVYQADGTTPIPDAYVTATSTDNGGPLVSEVSKSTWADGSGYYSFVGYPVGTVTVNSFGANVVGGVAAGELTTAGATLDVLYGNAVQLMFNLDGADGFRYDVDCEGDLYGGGTSDYRLSDAYDGAYYLRTVTNGVTSSAGCFDVAESDPTLRQLSIGPSVMGGLRVKRKIFVPAEGGFARFLEVLSNPTDADVQTVVKVESHLGSYTNTRVQVGPAATGNTYAVTDDASGHDPSLGHVFEGPGASVPISDLHVVSGSEAVFYSWLVTVPAHQTRIVMHFALQREPAAWQTVQAAVLDLVSLTNASALAGMTAEEKTQVVNFNVPQ